MANFLLRAARTETALLCRCYTLILLEISHRTRWWCLKCVIVYLARDNLTKLLSAESLLEDKLKLAKSSYENNLAHKLANSESNKIYAYIYSLSSKHSLPPLMHFDSLSATTDSVKASLFNNYFYSIFTRSSFVLPTIGELPSVDSLISDISISDSDVYSELTKLDTSKAMGIDNIGPKILKFCAPALYQPIHHLFSLSLCLISAYQLIGISTL